MTVIPAKSICVSTRVRDWEWQQKRWQTLLDRKQNIEPAKNTYNGHVAATTIPSADFMSICDS